MATLAELRTTLRKRVGNPPPAEVPDSDLNSAINSAYGDVAARFKFYKVQKVSTFSTVLGTANYALPADCFALLRVRDNTNKKRLAPIGDREYASRTSSTNGKPAQYMRRGNEVFLEPPPDGVFQIEIFYKSKPADLANDADQPVVPSVWHEGILRLARYYFYDTVGDLPKATAALQLFNYWAETTPLEFDDEALARDSGVELPTLGGGGAARLDFDHGP